MWLAGFVCAAKGDLASARHFVEVGLQEAGAKTGVKKQFKDLLTYIESHAA
jgi:hypothetical protein